MKKQHGSPDLLLANINEQLSKYEEAKDISSLREVTLMIVDIEQTVRQLGRSVGVAAGLSPTSARNRIRGYLEAFPNQVIEGNELAAISGIAQYARRIRELRDEGFVIRTGPDSTNPMTGQKIRPDQYLFIPDEQPAPQRRT